MMHRRVFAQWLGSALLALAALAPQVALGHAAVKRATEMPASADLLYLIKARQKGISLAGEATVTWRVNAARYSVSSETRAAVLGKILENRSEGAIDAFGLAPATWYEKRFRKEPSTTTFDRAARVIRFGSSDLSYPLLGGEQDRASAQWQLAAVARASPDKMVAGSEWKFFVAGRKDAEQWTFKVIGREPVQTGLGKMEAVHFSKSPPADDPEQKLDLWLAPSRDWYPVKLRFADEDGEFVEQTLEKVTKK